MRLLEVEEERITVRVTDKQRGAGYGVPTEASNQAIVRLARSDGLLLDPVYTAKGMAAVLQEARLERVTKPVIFLHSGGVPALFAYADELPV
jgi:1-aminocyclopropane-1-carboxylate deaminase/D-cysteine desulfhydrase-like pyridoxal-dependent ACC family enzyme